jgi:DNA-binding response OmpR family regulator
MHVALDPRGIDEGAGRPELVPGRPAELAGVDAPGLSAPRERPLVLVVDDEAAIRLLCRVNLRLEGMDTIEAGDGAEALRLARGERPDLVLLDVMMPQLDGWQVANELGRDPATNGLPVVFLSARAEPADYLHGYELGAVGYVTKPFDPTALGSIINEVLERLERGERDELRRERLEELGGPHES